MRKKTKKKSLSGSTHESNAKALSPLSHDHTLFLAEHAFASLTHSDLHVSPRDCRMFGCDAGGQLDVEAGCMKLFEGPDEMTSSL